MCSAKQFHSNLVLIVMRRAAGMICPIIHWLSSPARVALVSQGEALSNQLVARERVRGSLLLSGPICAISSPAPKCPAFSGTPHTSKCDLGDVQTKTLPCCCCTVIPICGLGRIGAKNSRTNQAWNKQLLWKALTCQLKINIDLMLN